MCTLLMPACTQTKRPSDRLLGDTRDLNTPTGDIGPAIEKLAPVMDKANSDQIFAFDPSLMNIELQSLRAINFCQCTPDLSLQFMRRLSVAAGVLPQELVPDVREQVREDRNVKILLETGQTIRQILTAVFANDDKVRQSVLEGLFQKYTQGLGYAFSDSWVMANYKLDAFKVLPLSFGGDTDTKYDIGLLNLSDQSYLWNFTWTQTGATSVDLSAGDASYYKVFQMINTLTEWKYLFGLDMNSTTKEFYGGLTFNTEGRLRSDMKVYDPRLSDGPGRYVGGSLRLSYPRLTRLETILEGKENWQVVSPWSTLSEQANIWLSAARALRVLRPRNRTPNPTLFSETGLFPSNTHQLPLLILPGMRDMLKNHFVNADTRHIYETMFDENSIQDLAQMGSVVRLARALYLWLIELEDIDDLGVSGDLEDSLLEAPRALKQVLRLAVQTLIGRYTEVVEKEGVEGLVFVESAGHEASSNAMAFEALDLLMNVEMNLLPSPFLSKKIQRLNQHFIEYRLMPDLQKSQGFGGWDTLYLKKYLETLRNYYVFNQSKIDVLSSGINKAVENWK